MQLACRGLHMVVQTPHIRLPFATPWLAEGERDKVVSMVVKRGFGRSIPYSRGCRRNQEHIEISRRTKEESRDQGALRVRGTSRGRANDDGDGLKPRRDKRETVCLDGPEA